MGKSCEMRVVLMNRQWLPIGDTQDTLMWASLQLNFFRPMGTVQGCSGGLSGPGKGRVGGPRLCTICGVRRSGSMGRGVALWGFGLWLSPGGRRKQVRTEGAECRRRDDVATPQVDWEGAFLKGGAGTAKAGSDHG